MGFLYSLDRKHNFLATDFPEAYWKIDEIGLTEYNGVLSVGFNITAYPSREASKAEGAVEQLQFGGSMKHDFNAELYRFTDIIPASFLFPDYIPTDIAEIKRATYNYLKASYNLQTAIDVFEDGQEI